MFKIAKNLANKQEGIITASEINEALSNRKNELDRNLAVCSGSSKYLSAVILSFLCGYQVNAQFADKENYLKALDHFYETTSDSGEARCFIVSHRYAEFALFGTSASDVLERLDICLVNNFMKANGYINDAYINDDEFENYILGLFQGTPDIRIITKTGETRTVL